MTITITEPDVAVEATLAPEKVDEALSGLDFTTPTRIHVADLIRMGSKETKQAFGSWGDGETACALTAAAIAAQRLGIIKV
jgi:hypothetical protein